VAGLPGIGTQQDPIEYNSTTWHTNLDTYERIVPEDVMHNAVVTASVMWGLANRDEMLPRFAPSEMPAVPQGRGGGRGAVTNGPVALPHVYALAKGKSLSVRAPGLVEVGGRGGANASMLTATIVTKPAHGKLSTNPDGSFTYTPAASFTGIDSFTYTVATGGATSEPATVTLVIK
jgi:hypothetical protein